MMLEDGPEGLVMPKPEVAMAYSGGKEKRVNSTKSGNQSDPEVSVLEDGGWVVTWSSYGQDGSANGVYQQRYGASGIRSGAETLVPTTTTNTQDFSDVSSLADGGWVVTWSSRSSVASMGFQVRTQAYNADGSKQGAETQANTTALNDQVMSNVAGLDTGGWVVVWQSDDGDGVADIYQQRYNSIGAKLGGETLVNTVTASDQFDPAISRLDGGRWVVAWSAYGHAGDTSGIYAQVFNADGSKSGSEIHVNTHAPGNQYDPEVATLADGDFVVTWQSQDQDGSGYGVYQQRFHADGATQGAERRVNKAVSSDQDTADVAALSSGGYVVTWQSEGQDGSGGGIFSQVFDDSGSRLGKEFRVNRHANSDQVDCSVTGLSDGRFVVTWQSYDTDGDGGAIMQRVFSDEGAKQSADKLVLDLRPVIEGNGKDNTLTGTNIGEKFFGKGGDDTINGKGGNDLLDGGQGDDLLIGADGKDVFVFKTGYGGDTVRGFFDGDRIDLRGLDGVVDFDDLTADHLTQIGADVRIAGPDGDVLWIRHAVLGLMDENDFIFAV